MIEIKERQKEKGLIANVDKEFILSKIEEMLNNEQALIQYKKVIDARYTKVKMNIIMQLLENTQYQLSFEIID